MLKVGFYAFFEPVSYSASSDPNAADFNTHRGYEADLLTALEALEGAGLSFSRRAIEHWVDPNTGSSIWLQSARPEYDIVGGGITILDARRRNAAGEQTVVFTSGHIAFRQSLLVRAEDAEGLASHDDLTSDVRVGVIAGTTGEARLLVLMRITDAEGVLAGGTRVDTPAGTITADGSMAYVITAAGASPQLEGRQRLSPSSETMPQVIYLGGEIELLAALGNEDIDAVARGEIGNADAAHDSDGAFVVTAIDSEAEYGGFTVAVEDAALLALARDAAADVELSQCQGYGGCLEREPRIIIGGPGVSGGAFIDNAAFRDYTFKSFGARVLDMESAAVAHVAYANDGPFIAVRSLSDLAGGSESENQIEVFFRLAAGNSAAVVKALLRTMPE